MPEISKKLTPYNYTPMSGKHNQYIVIHYVGGVSTAKNNVDYYASRKLSASAHYFVDESSIWQCVDDKDKAWHCGGGLQGTGGHTYYKKCTNSNSIGIEMCCKKSGGKWYFEPWTISNAVELTKYLMVKYNIPAERVIRHYDVTGKTCPEPYVRDVAAWQQFKSALTAPAAPPDLTTVNDIVWELEHRGILTNKALWLKKLNADENAYYLAKGCVNYIRRMGKIPSRTAPELDSTNDIVWELEHRGILTQKDYWLQKLKNDTNSYWLARKSCDYIRRAE